MTLCKFFQAGTCTRGNSCNFEHVRPQNSFGVAGNTAVAASKYNEASIKLNLTEERPQWKLSVYGPAKEEPNLIVGTDRSCEEDRLMYYTSMRTVGNESQYIASHEQHFNQMETQVNAILQNPTGAIQHYEKEKQKHSGPFGGSAGNAPFAPFTGSSTGSFGASAFGSGGTSTFGGGGGGGGGGGASAFGQPSAFGAAAAKPVSAFGSSTSAFGSTSALGGGTSAFGSTSALGGGGSAFGSTSSLGGGGSAFGSTSALGSGSAFGSTSALGNTGSAFGQPSAFGAANPATTSAFGSTSTMGSAFGSTSTLGGGGAFGTPAPAPSTSAFGATSSLGSDNSAFGSTLALGATKPSAFGSSSTSTMGAFGTALPAAPSTTTNAFGNANNVPNSMATGGSNADGIEISQTSPEWQAFSASEFTYRAIPEIEPPIQLR